MPSAARNVVHVNPSAAKPCESPYGYGVPEQVGSTKKTPRRRGAPGSEKSHHSP